MAFTLTLNPAAAVGVVPVFGPPRSFEVADLYPVSLLLADFSNDGKIDVAVVNQWTGTVSVLLGGGDGTFLEKVDYDAGDFIPQGIAFADFNGDGIGDLVTGNTGGISLFLGHYDGTFGMPLSFLTGGYSSLSAADFDRDGAMDIVLAGGVNITLLLGNGAGSFESPAELFLECWVQCVCTGDFNDDGYPDVAVGLESPVDTDAVGLLLGDGDGNLGTPLTWSTGQLPRSLACGDFNGDGSLDLVVCNEQDHDISVLIADQHGGFEPSVEYAVMGCPSTVAVGDLNADGILDVAALNMCHGSVSILEGRGDGTFEAAASYAAGSSPQGAGLADLNGDGQIDLVLANVGSGTISALLNLTYSLSIAVQNGQVEISWPAPASGFVLESAGGVPFVWEPITEEPSLVGDRWQVSLSTEDSVRFFRLKQSQPPSF